MRSLEVQEREVAGRASSFPSNRIDSLPVEHPAPLGTPASPLAPLSRRESLLLLAIRLYIEEHGSPPGIRELRALTGISSTSVVSYNLQKLARRGLIKQRRETAKSIVLILHAGESCPYCHGVVG